MTGRLPCLAQLRAEGAWGAVRTEGPLILPSIWTTVATGRRAATHNVLSMVMPRPDGGGVAPVGKACWQAPAIWQALEAGGRHTSTIGWPGTWPATAWPGVHVDSRFAVPTGVSFDAWAVPPHAVSPVELRVRLRERRVHPTEITGTMLASFVPRLAEVDQTRDARLTELAVALATTATVHAAATTLIEDAAWDAVFVHYSLLDEIHQRFGCKPDAIWGDVVASAYAFVDTMLGRLMELAGPDTTLWVVSPNGVRGTADTPGIGAWRSRSGMIAARGRWIDAGSALPPARLIDIAPSVLARFGLTLETDGYVMRPLAPGRSQRRVAIPPSSAPKPDRHVDALRTIGYDDALSAAQASALAMSEGVRLLALSEALLEQRRIGRAERMLMEARTKLPSESLVVLQLALCSVLRGNAARCREFGDVLRRLLPQHGWGDLTLAAAFALEGNAHAAQPHMAKAAEKGADDPELLSHLGGVALLLNEDSSATSYFMRALELDPDMPAAHRGLARAQALTASFQDEPQED